MSEQLDFQKFFPFEFIDEYQENFNYFFDFDSEKLVKFANPFNNLEVKNSNREIIYASVNSLKIEFLLDILCFNDNFQNFLLNGNKNSGKSSELIILQEFLERKFSSQIKIIKITQNSKNLFKFNSKNENNLYFYICDMNFDNCLNINQAIYNKSKSNKSK